MSMRRLTSPPLPFVFVLFPCQQVLGSPVPQIIQPDPGPLSFLEFVQTSFHRIIEAGFLRGILTALLVLGCLLGLLIGALCGLAAYLKNHDTKLWGRHEELYVFGDEKNEQEEWASPPVEKRLNRSDPRYHNKSQSQDQNRISRYLSSGPSVPVTKITIYASPCRASTATSVLSAPPWTPQTPTRSSVRPLRSALSKSPPSSKRPSWVQTSPFRLRRGSLSFSPSPSPKSVRWADEVQMTMVEKSLSRDRAISTKGRPGSHIETDGRLRGMDGHGLDISDALAEFSSPTYHSHSSPISSTQKHKTTFATTGIQLQEAEFPSNRTTSMKLEGDTD